MPEQDKLYCKLTSIKSSAKCNKNIFSRSTMVGVVGGRSARKSDFFEIFYLFSLTISYRVGGHQILRSQIVGLIKTVNMSHHPTRSVEG